MGYNLHENLQETKPAEPVPAPEAPQEPAKGGLTGYLDKAKGAALGFLEKHPPSEEPKTGISGYFDKAKAAAKSYLEKPK